MIDTLPESADALLTRRELSRILPVSYHTLAHWAVQGEGPPFIRINSRVVAYRAGDVREWLMSQPKGGQP